MPKVINPATKLVIPAAAERRAGIQKRPSNYWIPAFAGMTIIQLISDRYHRRHTRQACPRGGGERVSSL